MATTLMSALAEAEKSAEQIRSEAALKAREIIKAAEQAAAESERVETAKTRELVAQTLSEKRRQTEREIAELAASREEARQSALRVASIRAERAGQTIFERVIANGNR